MNTGQMIHQVLRDCALTSDDPLVTRYVVIDAINEAQRLIEETHDWAWLQTSVTFASVAGQRAYTLPSNHVATRRVIDPDGIPLTRFSPEQLEYDWEAFTGTPQSWTVDDETLQLFPTPNTDGDVYTHEYQRTVTELAADSDISIIPAQYHWGLVTYAVEKAYVILGKLDRAQAAAARFAQCQKVMARAHRRDRGPLRARIREDAWL